MNCSKLITSILAIFTFVFFYECVIHGVCLQNIYALTPELWRTPDAMNEKMHFMLLSQFLYAAAFTVFYAYLFKNTRDKLNGLTYGIFVGIILSVVQIGIYAYMPISFELMAYWVVSTFIESLLSGALLAIIWPCSFCVKK
tara:strand:- start:128 stop:550 length:423 start_codon:yes stop_codon:yes gene_type:complete